MPDFSNYRRLNLRITNETTAVYKGIPLPGVELDVAVAGEPNQEYWKEVLRLGQLPGARDGRRVITPEHMAEDRDRDRKLWARYIIKGWRGVEDANGEVPYTPENCLAWISDQECVPDDWFDALRSWCQTKDNFRSLPSAKEAAKN